jgi:hypothetical protein
MDAVPAYTVLPATAMPIEIASSEKLPIAIPPAGAGVQDDASTRGAASGDAASPGEPSLTDVSSKPVREPQWSRSEPTAITAQNRPGRCIPEQFVAPTRLVSPWKRAQIAGRQGPPMEKP